jgi:hypothetical protein
MIEEPESNEPPLLSDLFEVLYNDELGDRERVSELFRYVEGHFVQSGLVSVDLLLEQFDATRCPLRIANGLLRCTGRAKLLLPHWFECRNKILIEYQKTPEEDWKHKMRGLLNDLPQHL